MAKEEKRPLQTTQIHQSHQAKCKATNNEMAACGSMKSRDVGICQICSRMISSEYALVRSVRNMLSYDQFGSLFDDLVRAVQGISLLSQKQGSENIENDIMWPSVYLEEHTSQDAKPVAQMASTVPKTKGPSISPHLTKHREGQGETVTFALYPVLPLRTQQQRPSVCYAHYIIPPRSSDET